MKKQFFRVKQLADQTFSRSGKSENLTDELQAADRKVEQLRTALQALCKRLTPSGSVTQGQDPAAREKRLRKLPEFMLGLTMQDASNFEDETLLKYILQECAKTEISLANEIAEHELKVEQLVCAPLNLVSDQDLPAIMKSKKQLNRLMGEKDSASSRYQHLLRQGETNPTKVSGAREEWEESCARVESARDILAADMFALLAKETQLAHTLLQFIKLQRAYHESALHSLQEIVPDLERFLNDSSLKPVFGYPLEQHLRVTGRAIAFPIELCICALHELGLAEEGLFRIAGGSSKVRRMKLSLDAGIFSPPLQSEYRDVHVVASVLKCYLRELPEPLLTYRLYDTFLLAVTRQTAEQARLNAIWDAIHHLPETNFNNLRYIIKFLSALTQNQSTNKMTPSNLAIVIAPNLLWAPDETTFDMNITTSINCVVELLIKHADWFFSEDINFFLSFTKEDLLPDLCEYGFTPNFVQGTYAHTMAMSHDQSNGGYDSMTKSMNDYSNRGAPTSLQGKHSRSNSHDTSLILIDNEIKRAQSNSSLSDQSSPPQGSPKPILRRKNKPIAPVPPNFTPPDKKHKPPADTQKTVVELPKLVEPPPKTAEVSEPNVKDKATNTKSEADRPNKPPRPVVSDCGKIISGVQTINRSTYKQNKLANKLDEGKSTSRESLNELRRQSLDYDREAKPESENKDAVLVVKNITAQTGVVGRMKVLGENYQTSSSCGDKPSANVRPKQSVQPPVRPVASPRTIVPIAKPEPDLESPEIQLRNNGNADKFVKPAIPERPPALRPQSFRNSAQRNSLIEVPTSNATGENSGATVLERTHVYSVDKQHPTIIQVGSTPTKSTENSESKTEESHRAAIQRTHSTGSQNKSKDEKEGTDEQKSLSSLSRQLSQSEGSIIDVPPSPRPNPNRPPRPQVPAPPPPTTSRPKSQDNPESTKL